MLELAIVVLLVVLNGLFALSELAIVSARRSRLRSLAEAGRRGAPTALALADDPGRFLSTVQIGITLVGLVAGAFSGATLGQELTATLAGYGAPPVAAEWLGIGVVIVGVTYLSLIVGELVPKNLALRNPEAIACTVAPFMNWLSRVCFPAVWLLDRTTRAILFILGQRKPKQGTVTEEEIKSLVAEAETAGVLESEERELISGVLRLGDRAVRGLMTPRTDVDWIDVLADEAQIRTQLIGSLHSRLPVGEGSPDRMIGVVQVRKLLAEVLSGKPLDVRAHTQQVPIIPETMDALDVLETLREAEVPMAFVLDEYGHFEGLVTPTDILEAIAGVFRSDLEGREPYAVERDDGSWLLSGAMPADEMADKLGIALEPRREYQTVAGFVLARLGRLPQVCERVEAYGWRFEVVDMDGRRVDKVLAMRLASAQRRVA